MTREETNEHARELYEVRKHLHICTKCCHRRAELNKTMCSVCLTKQSEYNAQYFAKQKNVEKATCRARELREKRRQEGVCVLCGKQRYPNHMRCYECMLRDRRQHREAYVPKERTCVPIPPRCKPADDHPWRKANEAMMQRGKAKKRFKKGGNECETESIVRTASRTLEFDSSAVQDAERTNPRR